MAVYVSREAARFVVPIFASAIDYIIYLIV